MINFEVLIEGRADFSQKVWFDYCSTTLITNSEGNIYSATQDQIESSSCKNYTNVI